MLDQFSPGEIVMLVVGAVLAAAGAVNTIGAAVERIVKLRQAAQAPNAVQDKRIDALEGRMTVAEGMLRRDYAEFQKLTAATGVTHRALLALLGHGLHGNNVEEMAASEKELKSYLTNHH